MNRKRIFALGLCVAVSAVCAVRAADYPRVILAQQPAGYYRLDDPAGAATARDLSPAHANATYNLPASAGGAAPETVAQPGISTNSAVFSGGANSLSITIPYSAALSPLNADGLTGAPFSVECWVRPAAASPASPMCALSVAGLAIGGSYAFGSGWDFSEMPGSAAAWRLTMRSQQGPVSLSASSPVVPARWNHLAATWDGTTAIFYVNGVASQSNAVPGYLAAPNFAGTIGAGPNTVGGAFQGAIAEVVFYTNALAGVAISNHFALGQAILSARASAAAASSTNP